MNYFEDFLEENFHQHSEYGDSVYVKDLGEWAWLQEKKKIEGCGSKAERDEVLFQDLEAVNKNWEVEGDCWIYFEVALACLGREEMLKRLEALK
jgi:hypothetical protein